ncbi:4-alpha-glucanotransferase [Anaeromicropila populeti]|uniref:4-alpha-glucanotransferase n=1 Tax=Anaeromicropila populeti TaxID=37658 RepID=A0A1I6J7Z0_9FIRM|nr:4-alpha-glucanotransferase [Anaeromicropila populeti]SFR75069.1 4-alpha-glucanotransferase [Anaeromicropila populeti]
MRVKGVSLPVFELAFPYGTGTFLEYYCKSVDNLKKMGQKCWEVSVLRPIQEEPSAKQVFSCFAGNPGLIDLQTLIEEDLLTKKECEDSGLWGEEDCFSHEMLYYSRYLLFQKAFERFSCEKKDFQDFVEENRFWLEGYSLFEAIREQHNGQSWNNWVDGLRFKEPKAIQKFQQKCEKEIQFYQFEQYLFDRQWKRLHEYARQEGIQIKSSIPFSVAVDGVDRWYWPELFQVEHPFYDWETHRQTDFTWWKQRMRHSFLLYDEVQIDLI